MTDLTLLFNDSYSPESFPSVVDLGKVTKLSLFLDVATSLTLWNSGCIIDLLKQTDNIQSLVVHGGSFLERDPFSAEEIYSVIIRHVERSKLRHLKVPICNLNHFQRLFDRFRDLFSIGFFPVIGSITSEEIIAHIKAVIPGCSVLEDYPVVSIWIGQQLERTNDSERVELSARSSL